MGELTCAAIGAIVRVHAPDLAEFDRVELAGRVDGLAVVGKRLVASGAWGAVELAVRDAHLTIVREHARPHWSRRFQPGPTTNTLVSLGSTGLQTWRWRRHRLDRSRLPHATRLRFPVVPRPEPTDKAASIRTVPGADRRPLGQWSGIKPGLVLVCMVCRTRCGGRGVAASDEVAGAAVQRGRRETVSGRRKTEISERRCDRTGSHYVVPDARGARGGSPGVLLIGRWPKQ
jgi:hypothetical protein